MSMLFRLRKKGSSNSHMLFANDRTEAVIKLQQLVRSRKILTVRKPMLMPNSLMKTRTIFRGRR